MKGLPFLVALSLFSLSAFSQTSDEPNAQRMEQMQARMQTMREQMARIHATEDPEERQRLMQEHMQSMHEGMMMMGEMMRAPMEQGGPTGQCRQNDMECRMEQLQTQHGMMGRRMGMMHQMMEQMTEQMMEMQGAEREAGDEEHH